ncbi:hypothetical protein [Pedobacter terrae]|uniref:hypothetical protein n=1 Tax=Pedobacter terrae TaxID=405671 RepID=UPI002FF4F78D
MSGVDATKQVLDRICFFRLFAGQAVMGAGRALDAYDEEGINGYINVSIGNTHREIGMKFSNGQYINPWENTRMSLANLFKFTKRGTSDLELVGKAADKAEAAIGGTGRFAGTAKHTYANNLLNRYQRIYGDRGLNFNQYFNNNFTL